MNSLYETFGCENKEQLYKKIIEEVDDVSPLLDFLDYSKGNISSKEKNIASPEILFKYLKDINKPSKDIAQILFVDTKHKPVYVTKARLSRLSDVRRAIGEGLQAGASFAFLSYHNESKRVKVEQLVDTLESIGIKTKDKMAFDKNKDYFISEESGSSFSKIIVGPEINYPDTKMFKYDSEIKDFSNHEDYNEFSSYLAEKYNDNLDIISDREQIKTNLKIGFQHEKQEIFGCLFYDENNKVKKSVNLFKGGVASSIADPRIIFKELLKDEAIKGFMIYHNHPSGISSPSNEDIDLTKRLANSSKLLGIDFCDHIVIGKEKPFSFVEETIQSGFTNIEYITEIMKEKRDDLSNNINNLRESDSIYNDNLNEFKEKEIIFQLEMFEEICSDFRLDFEKEYEKFEIEYKEFKENNPIFQLEPYVDFWDNYNASLRMNSHFGLSENIYILPDKGISDIKYNNSSFEDIKNTLSNMIYNNYENYVKAVVSLEKSIDDMNVLDKVFNNFMADDSLVLLDKEIESLIEVAEKTLTQDKMKVIKENTNENNKEQSKENTKKNQISL